MGNAWSSNNKRDYSKHWSPYGDDFSKSERRKSKRWSLRKPRGYYKTVSDLDIERGIPLHLHYQAPNALEEDLFTMDSRIPCVIHLHQRTRQDINQLLRGTDAYSKGPRPKSLDPQLLLDGSFAYDDMDPYSSPSPRNSSFLSSSAHINHRVTQQQQQQQQEQQREDVSHATPDQKMKIDSSCNIDIIKVDTSGAKFDRQAHLRRSHRLSSCTSVRQRPNASQRRHLRHKHKTLTGLPGDLTSEIHKSPIRPYSLHSGANGSSFVEGVSSDESRSLINGHLVASPTRKHAEIQTDAVRVIPLTPAQRRMKQKGIKSNHASPASSRRSTEFLASPTAVPCPTVSKMKQTSTPVNGVLDRDLIRPSTLDVKNNDTSTDEGRHTGESNPPTPVRSGTPNELSASPQRQKSPSSPMTTNHQTSNGDHHGNSERPNNIAMRANGARLEQGEDRASSGCWSGTESVQHSSSSDITIQHAPVMNVLQHILKRDKPHSPIFVNSAGQISPIVSSRPLISSSAASSSSVSINSKLSTLDFGTSTTSSICEDDDERFQSGNSSVVNVTLNRSNNTSTLSLNSPSDGGGTVMSAAAMLKKSRKGRSNATAGLYSFMNYEVDPLEPTIDELPRAVKNRRSTRSAKHRGGSKKRLGADDTISVSSMADKSPQNTEADAHSTHSEGKLTNDTASLCDSMFSVDQEGYFTSMHEDCGLSKSSPPCSVSVTSMPDSISPIIRPVTPNSGIETIVEVHPASPVFEEGTRNNSGDKLDIEIRSNSYNSYNRAVKSNHSTPKSLLSPRGKSASVKSPKPVDPPALDFQSELNKRLSVRRTPGGSKSSTKKDKRRTPPPPPKRASSLSSCSSPSPSSSVKSLSEREPPQVIPAPVVASPANASSPVRQKVIQTAEEYYKSTPPPPPPIDQLPPPPPELLETEDKTAFEYPQTTVQPPPPPIPTLVKSVKVKSPASSPPLVKSSSPKSPITEDSPYHSIAMQAAMLGSRMSQKKIDPVKHKVKSEPAAQKHETNRPKFSRTNKINDEDVTDGSAEATKTLQTVVAVKSSPQEVPRKVPPPTAAKTPTAKSLALSAVMTTDTPAAKTPPPPTAPKTSSVTSATEIPPPAAPAKIPPLPLSTVTTTDTPATKTPPPPTAPKTSPVTSAVEIPPPAAPAKIPPLPLSTVTTTDTPAAKTPPPPTAPKTSPVTSAAEIPPPAAPAKIPPLSHSTVTTTDTPAAKTPPPPTAPKTSPVTSAAEIPPPAAPAKIPPLSHSTVTTTDTPAAKTPPPPTAPKTSPVTSAAEIPPPVALAKIQPLVAVKSTREQSPSYKASMARAAFFSRVSPPTPKVAPKPAKVPLVASTQKQESVAEQTEDIQKSEEKQEISPEKSENVESPHDQQNAWVKDECNEISTAEPQEEKTTPEASEDVFEPEVQTPDSNDWLEKNEEFLSPSPSQEKSISDVTSEHESAAARLDLSASRQTQKYPTHENLMAAIHKSKRVALSSKAANSSPPSSPGTNVEPFIYRTNGNNKSPGNTLERKRNGRITSNGHRNGISRRSSGGTSRDDFKALLLQNACRGSVGSQMTAAEKLQLNKPQQSAAAALSRQRPMSMNDAERKEAEEELLDGADESSENSRPVISLNDIRSAITSGSATTSRIGRSNRRGPRPNSMEPKYATLSLHGKKHPPPSMSSKYNTRSKTPTRPMMSIDEDSETEKSPDQKHLQPRLQER